jgi:hypothetical protein
VELLAQVLLEQLVPQVPQVHKVLLAYKEQQVREQQVLWVLQEQAERLDQQVLQVREQQAQLGRQVPQVYKVLVEQLAHKVLLVLVLQVSLALTVLMDQLVPPDHKVIRAPPVLEQQELKEQLAQRVRQVLTELMEPQVLLVLPVLLV